MRFLMVCRRLAAPKTCQSDVIVQNRNVVRVVKGIDPVVAGQTDLCLEKRPAESEGACSAFNALKIGATASLGDAAARDTGWYLTEALEVV